MWKLGQESYVTLGNLKYSHGRAVVCIAIIHAPSGWLFDVVNLTLDSAF